jgi:hypothetical protein
MKIDTSREDKEFLNTLDSVNDLLQGKDIKVVVPVLMSLLCACAEMSGMKEETLIMYFIASVQSHFAMPDDESIH